MRGPGDPPVRTSRCRLVFRLALYHRGQCGPVPRPDVGAGAETGAAAGGDSASSWSVPLLDQLQHDSETPSCAVAQQELEERLNRAVAEWASYRRAVELRFRGSIVH